jgi:hypothetical protein
VIGIESAAKLAGREGMALMTVLAVAGAYVEVNTEK